MLRSTARAAAFIAFSCAILLGSASCAARVPLDPLTGDTGGPLTANERATDVLRYRLDLEVFPEKESIRGRGVTTVRAMEPLEVVQLQLDPRFKVTEVTVDGAEAEYLRERGVITAKLPSPASAGDEIAVGISYHGRPHVARRPPWQGGFVWARTEAGLPWIATAVQGEGCDLWWPCKDHYRDKPDVMDVRVTVPPPLSVAFNGVLQEVVNEEDGRATFHWRIGVPISDYNVSLNIGPFIRIQSSYRSVNGAEVPLEFWALPEHEAKVRSLIDDDLREQVAWFERRLGPYPWGGEKLGFVETPHLGMEHQTLNAYGNQFRRDPHGFDWLLQHELAHEWFGNLMTHDRLNDAWLHEGFGAYMQAAYSLDRDGEASYAHRMYETYLGLTNCLPVVQEGELTSDEAFTGDIYGKGAWTLHTLRWLIGEEPFWRSVGRLLYGTAEPWQLPYPISPVFRSTGDFQEIVREEAGRNLDWLFDVYLRRSELPELLVQRSGESASLAWIVPDNLPFPMPVPVKVAGEITKVEMPGGKGRVLLPHGAELVVDPEMKLLRRLPIIAPCENMRS